MAQQVKDGSLVCVPVANFHSASSSSVSSESELELETGSFLEIFANLSTTGCNPSYCESVALSHGLSLLGSSLSSAGL